MDEKNFVTMEFHNEYAKRMQEEHDRQNQRIGNLETEVKDYRKLALSIERLAISVKTMVEEQKAQGERLETLEKRDGEMWRKVVGYICTTIAGIVLGYIFKQFGF